MLLAPSMGMAFGNDERWVSGFGQGVKEAVIRKGSGNSIYVACSGSSSSPSSVNFSLAGRSPTGDSVTLTFDGLDPERIWISKWGEVSSDCRACATNFDYVINKLKSHSSVHVMFENGDSARFTLEGSANAIGQCKAGFYQ
jgi:hypothetical protein